MATCVQVSTVASERQSFRYDDAFLRSTVNAQGECAMFVLYCRACLLTSTRTNFKMA